MYARWRLCRHVAYGVHGGASSSAPQGTVASLGSTVLSVARRSAVPSLGASGAVLTLATTFAMVNPQARIDHRAPCPARPPTAASDRPVRVALLFFFRKLFRTVDVIVENVYIIRVGFPAYLRT